MAIWPARGGRFVVSAAEANSLDDDTPVIDRRDGGESFTWPMLAGFTKYEIITFKRGIARDTEFVT